MSVIGIHVGKCVRVREFVKPAQGEELDSSRETSRCCDLFIELCCKTHTLIVPKKN